MKVPFFPNTPDGTHCFQASIAMAIGFFRPELKLTFTELDKISAKEPGKWTWPTAAMLWMIKQGFELRLIEDFDYEEFARRGGDYIIDKCGKEVGEAQISHSIIEKELGYAKEFARLNLVERRLPTFNDIRMLLRNGYLVLCNVNAAALYEREGYSAHFVLVYQCEKKTITIHDPGLPPHPGFKVPLKIFEKAWAYPSENEKNLLAIKG